MSAIKAGDLVIVAHWPHRHLPPRYGPGAPFVCGPVTQNDVYCQYCDEPFAGPTAHTPEGLPIPAAWLKRIDPLSEPECTEHDEAVPA